jgi:predicted nuclease of restriction endonuclease-like (RecB) superfamily
MKKKARQSETAIFSTTAYPDLVTDISGLLEQAYRMTVRAVNSILTATYWEIGRRIVEFEQGGREKAEYGEKLIAKLAADLTMKHGRGFSKRNVEQMRAFYLGWEIAQTPSAQLRVRAKCSTLSGISSCDKFLTLSGISAIGQTVSSESLSGAFPLSWSHYVRLISVENPLARTFYEAEAIRGGWSVRQLDRQIGTQFFERTNHSKRQDIMLAQGQQAKPEDTVTLQEQIRDPYLLEFLNLRDEYGETELEDAIIRHLEWFLLELGAGFAFVARQKRVRIGDEWYRMDLLLYHRRLKCLVVIDLKLGKFTHADAGQMNLYLNYAREHLVEPGENEPVGLILCSARDNAVVHYAMGGIKANVFASRYMTILPDEETLRKEILTTKRALETRVLPRNV